MHTKFEDVKRNAGNSYVMSNDLETHIFGKGYKIIKSRLKIANPKTALSEEEKTEIIKSSFICKNDDRSKTNKKINLEEDNMSHIPHITEDNLNMAINKIKINKAPGPDAIPPKVIKAAIAENKDIFEEVFYNILTSGNYPIKWRLAKLILIEKPKKRPTDKTAYRPICLIDVIGKTMETIITTGCRII